MTVYLNTVDVFLLHQLVIRASGGLEGLRDRGGLEASVAQPRQTFGGVDLYPDLASKASSLCFGLVSNHPFIDGNKRIGHAAMAISSSPIWMRLSH